MQITCDAPALSRPRTSRRLGLTAAAALSLALSGCVSSGFGGLLGSSDGPEVALVCPSIAIVEDARQTVVTKPGGESKVEDIIYGGLIDDAALECVFFEDKIEVLGQVDVILEVGGANPDRKVSASYFIAIADIDTGAILSKNEYVAKFHFGNKPYKRLQEPFREVVEGIDPTVPHRLQLLVGFQLTEEQLEANRERRRGPRPFSKRDIASPLIADPGASPATYSGPAPTAAGQAPPLNLQQPDAAPAPRAAPRMPVQDSELAATAAAGTDLRPTALAAPTATPDAAPAAPPAGAPAASSLQLPLAPPSSGSETAAGVLPATPAVPDFSPGAEAGDSPVKIALPPLPTLPGAAPANAAGGSSMRLPLAPAPSFAQPVAAPSTGGAVGAPPPAFGVPAGVVGAASPPLATGTPAAATGAAADAERPRLAPAPVTGAKAAGGDGVAAGAPPPEAQRPKAVSLPPMPVPTQPGG